jgi:hypothetical protein
LNEVVTPFAMLIDEDLSVSVRSTPKATPALRKIWAVAAGTAAHNRIQTVMLNMASLFNEFT